LVARFIHRRSQLPGHFVILDHVQLAGQNLRINLLGCELDGKRQLGVFTQASGGSLLLGDLQDIPGDAQKIILQVLESGQYLPEGGASSLALNCRLMASGCEDLAKRARGDSVFEQLYYRLNVLPLFVPPLRERPEDVPDLVRHYADWFPNNEGLPYRSFSVSAQNRLRNHGWPGNIRELRNLVQRLLILGGDGEVTVAEVEEALRQSPAEPAHDNRPPEIFKLPLREAREQFEREYLSYQLQQAKGSVGKLAESVGMERTHLYRKLRALGIDPKSVAKQGTSK